MDELKSAWEIAQERVTRLGRLSAEEQQQQERDRCRQTGRALAGKWLDGPDRLDLPAELGRHGEDNRAMVKQALIEHLVEVIEPAPPRSVDRVARAIAGIESLAPELQPQVEEMRKLLHEYAGAEQKARQELESTYRERLHQLRISGTAVAGINLEASEEWQAARQRLVEDFVPRFDDLKRALIT